MPFVRLSLMTPRPDQRERVEELLDKLIQLYQGRPGFIDAYRLSPDPHSGSQRLGRVSIWQSEAHVNEMANDDTDLAIQSQLRLFVEPDASHEEYSFQAFGGTAQ